MTFNQLTAVEAAQRLRDGDLLAADLVDACLTQIDAVDPALNAMVTRADERAREEAASADEIELALWFHDVVYEPGSGDNEELSAALARQRLDGLEVPLRAVRRIAGHIEATRCHDATGGDSALVNDLDLTILGMPAAEFDRFERRIRLEYGHVPEASYRIGRRRLLEHFGARSKIYRLPALGAELEATARTNIQRRIRELTRR